MPEKKSKKPGTYPGMPPKGPSVFTILKPYRAMVALLTALTLAANGLTLWVPKLISHAIDAYARHTLVLHDVAWELGWIAIAIFIFTYLQNIVQTFASEKVARDMRNNLAGKISRQSHAYIQQANPSKLLTNLTSDIDSVKLFVAQAIASLISSFFLIIGASALLLATNWRLASVVLLIVPVIGVVFFLTLRKVRALFFKSREIIDRLNRVINESILGSALIRVLNSRKPENDKFKDANGDARNLGLQIVKIFAGLIPVITFVASLATFTILLFGGHLIIINNLSLGDFAAFSTYMSILIFPILIIGFMSNIIAQATASYTRIAEVLNAPEKEETGTRTEALRGDLATKNITMSYGDKSALKDVSFFIKGGTKTAIIGPTAAGKTQLLYILTGLIEPSKGTVEYDNHPLDEYEKVSLHRQVGFVFQDSIIFNMSLRENIGFSTVVTEADMKRAITTAELTDFVESLPKKLDTVISERGSSLSGGQKQRLMLARALALNPKILLLDDFTSRVDALTEKKILTNLAKNYPDLTLVSVTQKVTSVEEYDKIILLMEGELLAEGTHKELMKTSPEYVQIYTTQQSTNTYDVHAQ
jgi:ATP-binding cassette subfamily B protein